MKEEDMPDMTDVDITSLKPELYKQRWSLVIRGARYLFPEQTTLPEVHEVIRRAALLNQTRHN